MNEYAHPEVLVSTDWVASHLKDAGLRIIESNTRQPIAVIGDLRAQLAACRAGERGLTEAVRRYGADKVRVYTDELQRVGERLMRAPDPAAALAELKTFSPAERAL